MALDEGWVFYVADPAVALTEAAAESEGDGPLAVPATVEGLVVVSQTCDIVSKCVDRPFVDVSPLCRLAPGVLHELKRGQSTRFACLPGVPHAAPPS